MANKWRFPNFFQQYSDIMNCSNEKKKLHNLNVIYQKSMFFDGNK